MTQLTLQFENNAIKNHFLKIVELMNGVTVVKPRSKTKTQKSGLDEALEDVKMGCVSEYASVDDFFKDMGL